MRALIFALAFLALLSLGSAEYFDPSSAVWQYDNDGAYQIIFQADGFAFPLGLSNGTCLIGSVAEGNEIRLVHYGG